MKTHVFIAVTVLPPCCQRVGGFHHAELKRLRYALQRKKFRVSWHGTSHVTTPHGALHCGPTVASLSTQLRRRLGLCDVTVSQQGPTSPPLAGRAGHSAVPLRKNVTGCHTLLNVG